MNSGTFIDVLICDDHPIMQIGIAAIIQSQPDMRVIAQAGTAQEAIRMFQKHHPDITLMDLRLPDTSGAEAIRAIRRSAPAARIIVLTTYEGDEDIHQALEAGAMGYLIKGMPHEVLVDAVRKVHAGRRFLPRPITLALASRMPDGELSAREKQVLVLTREGKKQSRNRRRTRHQGSHRKIPRQRHPHAFECHRPHAGRCNRAAARTRSPLIRFGRIRSHATCSTISRSYFRWITGSASSV